ncbi:hypothetical protein M3Y99_00286200 [Aphelenchoides fujianensis]|nr:hypothetical protein M3Y99_00286200 [Aphelenchoides fujianensis]
MVESKISWKKKLALYWAEATGQTGNPKDKRNYRITCATTFLLLLYVLYVNVRHWWIDPNSWTNERNSTNDRRLFLPSPTVLFYGERDDWEDTSVYFLLWFLLLLSHFLALCLKCWPLFVPGVVAFVTALIVAPLMLLTAIARYEHALRTAENAHAGRLWELIGMAALTAFLAIAAFVWWREINKHRGEKPQEGPDVNDGLLVASA